MLSFLEHDGWIFFWIYSKQFEINYKDLILLTKTSAETLESFHNWVKISSSF